MESSIPPGVHEGVAKRASGTTGTELYRLANLPDAPFPVDLTDLPIVLSTKTQPKPGPDGVLPKEAYVVEHELNLPDGRRLLLDITGHPRYGLPYGETDLKVWVALFSLIDRHGWYDGVIRDASVGMIVDAVGADQSAAGYRAVRDALNRLSQVRFSIQAITRTEQLTLALAGGGENPTVLPVREVVTEHDRDSGWVIEYGEHVRHRRVTPVDPTDPRWDEDSAGGKYQTEHRIKYLRVNPALVKQAVNGWAAWIDLDRYRRLRSPYAMRLYILLAGRAARERVVAGEWTYSLGYLRAVCAADKMTRAAHVARRMHLAAEALKEIGVLKEATYHGANGNYTFTFVPGPELRLASWFYGIRPTDLEETRVLLATLARFGVSHEEARKRLAKDESLLRHLVQYAIYLEQKDPGALRNPAGFILSMLDKRKSFASDKAFVRWLENGGKPPKEKAQQITLAPPPEATRCTLEPKDPEAVRIWQEVLSALSSELPRVTMLHFEHLAPYEIVSDTLVCCATNSFSAEWVLRSKERVRELLGAASGGRVLTLKVTAPPEEQSA